MKLVGKNYTVKDSGETLTTLHVIDDFSEYQRQADSGRFCEGHCCDNIYVGVYDCTKLVIGSEIEIFYDKAIQTKTGGIFQPVREIRMVRAADK